MRFFKDIRSLLIFILYITVTEEVGTVIEASGEYKDSVSECLGVVLYIQHSLSQIFNILNTFKSPYQTDMSSNNSSALEQDFIGQLPAS